LFIRLFGTVTLFGDEGLTTLAVLEISGNGIQQTTLDLVYGYTIDRVNRSKKYSIVERNALDKVLKELKISHSDIIDEKTATQIGKLSGAEYILISALILEKDTYYLSMRIISVKTGNVIKTSVKNAKEADQIANLTKEAVENLIDVNYSSIGAGIGVSFTLGDAAAVWNMGYPRSSIILIIWFSIGE
jgi:hypothetical protein